MSARPGLTTVLRDTVSWLGGWALIFKQAGIGFVPPAQVNEFLILMAAGLIGVPGLAQLVALRFGGTSSTGGEPPASPPPALPPSSSGEPSREPAA